jgi:5'(3')-deoxyribonucleotidase
MARSSNNSSPRPNSPDQPVAHPEKILPESIGFDFDGVIADIGEAFIRLACNKYHYCSISLEDISSFQVEDCLDIPRTLVESIFDDILQDSLATGLKPMTGAIDTLARLNHIGGVTVITARPLVQPVQDWFEFYCAPESRDNIRLVATGDHDNKETFIRECGLSHFVDDRTLTCQMLADAGLSPIVYTQPWNRNQHKLPAVSNWDDIAGLFDFSISANRQQ